VITSLEIQKHRVHSAANIVVLSPKLLLVGANTKM